MFEVAQIGVCGIVVYGLWLVDRHNTPKHPPYAQQCPAWWIKQNTHAQRVVCFCGHMAYNQRMRTMDVFHDMKPANVDVRRSQEEFLDEIIQAVNMACDDAVAERQLNIIAGVFRFLNATRRDPHLIVGIGCSREEWDELSAVLQQINS